MDSVTHIVTGAALGELLLGKKAGNKALLWGAIAGSFPDIDAAFAPFYDSVVDELVYHRGFTHSIIFSLVISALAGIGLYKINSKTPVSAFMWGGMFFINMIVHILLDCFTTWGTQIFWPHPARIEIKNIFVIDPLFTLPLLITVIWLMFYRPGTTTRKKLNRAGLMIAGIYMALTFVNKAVVSRIFQDQMQLQGIEFIRYETKPAPLQNILWSVTAEAEDGFYIGYYSHLDSEPDTPYYYFPKNHDLLQRVLYAENVQRLVRVTDQYFTVENKGDSLLFNDLRFGQNNGWYNSEGNFIFSYFIIKDGNEVLVKKQENSFDNAGASLKKLWERIKGV